MKKKLLSLLLIGMGAATMAQETYPVNGSKDYRNGQFVFTNANIVVSANQSIKNGTLIIKDQIIENVGTGLAIPKGYVVIDLKGKFISRTF